MNEDELDRLIGQMTAMSMVVGAVMRGLSPDAAARTGMELLRAQQLAQRTDAEYETPQATIETRDLIVDTYLEPLRAVLSDI